MKRILLAAFLGVASVLGLTALPSATSSDITYSNFRAEEVIPTLTDLNDENYAATMANQDALDEVGDIIRDRYENNALTGIALNPVKNEIWIWFHPNVPEEVYELQSKYPKIRFNFEISKYSKSQLTKQQDLLFEFAKMTGIKIAAISLPADGSGLTIKPHTSTADSELNSLLKQVNLLIDSQDIIIGEPMNPSSAIATLDTGNKAISPHLEAREN